MVRKQIMVVTKDDWKLLKTNLNQNKQGKSIHIPSETTVLPLTFALFFVDILLILYLVIVFVYLNCICFSFLFFLSQSALLEKRYAFDKTCLANLL